MDIFAGKVFGFMMIMTRVSAFFATSPIFSWDSIPMRIKVTVAIFMSVFISSTISCPIEGSSLSLIEVIIMMSMEILYGLALGFMAEFLFASVKLGARFIERQMGLTMANVLNPLSGEQGQPVGMIMEMVFILFFLSLNGHHMFLMIISKSYTSFPIGSIPSIGTLTEGVTVAGSTMLLLGLKMSAPILAVFLLIMVALAVMARIAPETNILFLSMPIRIGVGLMMAGIYIPFISNFAKEYTQWIDKLLPI